METWKKRRVARRMNFQVLTRLNTVVEHKSTLKVKLLSCIHSQWIFFSSSTRVQCTKFHRSSQHTNVKQNTEKRYTCNCAITNDDFYFG